MIGAVELQATIGLRMLDLAKVDYLVVALFLAAWVFSLVYWKVRRVEERLTT
jgi:high-affinity nickel permease